MILPDFLKALGQLKPFAFDLNQPLIKPLRAFFADPTKESSQGLDERLPLVIHVFRNPL